jgi:ribosomal protein L28
VLDFVARPRKVAGGAGPARVRTRAMFRCSARSVMRRSRRIWKPNVVKVPLWSEALGQMVKLRVTTAVLKCVAASGTAECRGRNAQHD